MSNLKSIISSFKLQDKLNPKIWYLPNEKYVGDTKGQQEKMRPEIRKRLVLISKYFIDSFNFDLKIKDIIVTGSLVNYNWSKYSDVDLHILIDFKQFPTKQQETYKELLNLKKTIFNLKYDITVKGFDVEVYAQDDSESHFSTGTYSIKSDKWINYPKKENVKIDNQAIASKSSQWMKLIEVAVQESKEGNLEEGLEILKKCREKLKKFRQSGLEKKGEFSNENLVFKVLRRNGSIEKLMDAQSDLMNQKLTMNESTSTVQGVLKTDLENGPKNHASRALGNWQSDNAWDMFAPADTMVYSFTDGVVSKVYDTGKNSGKIFGTQISVKGENGFPNIFYTHLKDSKVKTGDKVKVGDPIGKISEWIGHPTGTHVHVGLPFGNHIRDLISGNMGELKFQPEDKKETIEKNIEELEKIELPLKIKPQQFDENIKIIQKSLETLGFELPIHGVDGIYGPETQSAIDKFKKENSISDEDSFLDLIFKMMDSKNKTINESSFASPLPNLTLTSPFGQKRGNINHPGVDLVASSGTEVTSPESGKVISSSFNNDACGGTLFIDHQNGYKTRYCHLKKINVSKGDTVSKGEVVGLTGGGSGDYGRGNSMGPHLHFEFYKDGKVVDPMEYLDKDYEIENKKGSDNQLNTEITKDFIEKLIKKLEELKSKTN